MIASLNKIPMFVCMFFFVSTIIPFYFTSIIRIMQPFFSIIMIFVTARRIIKKFTVERADAIRYNVLLRYCWTILT